MKGTQLVGLELCKAFGISPENVYYLQVTCEVGNVANLTIGRHIYNSDIENIEDIKKVISSYKLVEIKQEV